MTTQEFETQLFNLLNNAPEKAVVFLSYSHPETGKKCEFVKGESFDIIDDLSILLTGREDVQNIFSICIDAANQDFSKEYKQALNRNTNP